VPAVQRAATPFDDKPLRDTTYQLFLDGNAALSQPMVNELSVTIFHHIFVRYGDPNYIEVPEVLLLIIISKCKSVVNLEQIGIGFFRDLLAGVEPNLA
jgi:hypothetical protein